VTCDDAVTETSHTTGSFWATSSAARNRRVQPQEDDVKTQISAAFALAIVATGCSKHGETTQEDRALAAQAPGDAPAARAIAVDGSSTVFPISEAMAEEFQKGSPARVTVASSGTGGGFKKLCSKEVAMTGASRPIKPSEVETCKAHGVEYIELPVAYDGIAVVVNPQNSWVDHMTVEELKRLWAPEAQGKVKTWADVRTGWPKEEIHLFGAGVDSGTYDYFTMAIVGKEHSSRGDYTSSEDDNVLVKGISTDKLALGFFGLAYYEENKSALKLVPIDDGVKDNGDGPIAPSAATVENATYQPLARPIFIYVNRAEADRKEVQDFVHYYVGPGVKLVSEVGYIGLPSSAYELATKRFDARTTGSLFAGEGSKVGVKVTDLLSGK
jgi:phosphate transport system substrate-binding protein